MKTFVNSARDFPRTFRGGLKRWGRVEHQGLESARNFPRTLLRVSSNDVETFVNSAKDSPRTFLRVSAKDFKTFANSARDLPRTFRGGVKS